MADVLSAPMDTQDSALILLGHALRARCACHEGRIDDAVLDLNTLIAALREHACAKEGDSRGDAS